MTMLTRIPPDAFVPAWSRARSATEASLESAVREILERVRQGGDRALSELTERYDRWRPGPGDLELGAAEWDAAVAGVPPEVWRAIEAAAERIRRFHEPQRFEGYRLEEPSGVVLAQRAVPLDRVGLYVPGGTAAYPSSVLMNAVPAQVAGVPEIVMVTPAPDGKLNPVVLAAARTAGVQRVFRIGGAQAVGALAYGTETVPRVDKVVGPGNAWVAAAKRLVFGTVGIDLLAGPSEVLVVADRSANPAWLAADLLAQAEHDPHAVAGLITTEAELVPAVEAALAEQLQALPRRAIAAEALRGHGYAVVARDLADALRIANQAAPEHLELCVEDPWAAAQEIRHAGAIFLGSWTPEAVGDYLAGPNHVLPTAGTARFSSGLGVSDFVKRTNLLWVTENGLRELAEATMALAGLEGLDAHARSVAVRLGKA
jgi:histidinol dehydrogenase